MIMMVIIILLWFGNVDGECDGGCSGDVGRGVGVVKEVNKYCAVR